MRVAWVAVLLLLLAGCSSPPPKASESSTTDAAGVPTALANATVPLRFASGDFESISGYEATFQPTDSCIPQCSGTAEQFIDLTPVIPAEAPVELSITLTDADGIQANLVYTDADPVQASDDGGNQGGGGGGQGGGDQINALLSRSAAGTVQLRLRHQNTFSFNGVPPGPIVAKIEVRSVVRADVLVGGMPAAVTLPAGAVLNFTSDEIDQAVLITPAGEILRDVDAPFALTVPNNTAGSSIILVTGGTTQVLGPNVTMAARRVAFTESAPKDLAAGTTTLEITADSVPVTVGMYFESKPAAAFVQGANFLGAYTVTITAPGNVGVLSEECTGGGGGFPFCEVGLLFFGGGSGHESAYLDEHLKAGLYTISIETQQTNGYQAVAYVVQIVA